jgi:thioredoxin 1
LLRVFRVRIFFEVFLASLPRRGCDSRANTLNGIDHTGLRSRHSTPQEIFRVTSDKSDKIVHISDASFEADVLKARQPVLLDFWAEWCGPCKAIAPMLGEIAEEYRDKVTIAKLNVDENPRTSQRFNVRSIPTLILFKNGQVEGQKVGAPRKSDLVAFLDSKL